METQPGKARIGWLLGVLVLLALVALGVPDRMLTEWTYAVERGKLRASSEELAQLSQDLARIGEVSHAFRLVAKVAQPGVVHIRVRSSPADESDNPMLRALRKQLEEQLGDDFDEEDWQDFLRQHRDAPASASGIIFDQDGHILTNNHVVTGRSEIRVVLPDDREYEARLIGSDPKTDLAVVKIDAPDLHPLQFGDSDRMEVGDWVVAVGAPFGLSQSVTHGIISATGRNDVITGRGIIYQNFLQTDAAINPGNSGGPLLNLRGEVIGVNTAIATNGDAYSAGIAFTIPSNMAVKIAEQLKRTGEVARGWLGITMGELTAADREIFGIDGQRGVLVASIIERAPADEAGLLVEDVILKVNGRSVSNMAELRGSIADILPGDSATLNLLRDGQQTEVTLKLGRRPGDAELGTATSRRRSARNLEELGLSARTLLPDLAPRLGYSERDRGIVVVELIDGEDGGPPVKPGELIVACNGRTVATVTDLARVLKASNRSDTLQLEVLSPSAERRVIEYRRR